MAVTKKKNYPTTSKKNMYRKNSNRLVIGTNSISKGYAEPELLRFAEKQQ